MDINQYNSLYANLAQDTSSSTAPPPVLEDDVDHIKESIKGGFEMVSGQLTGNALEKSIKMLRSKKIISPEEEEQLGDGAGGAVRVIKNRVVGAIKNALGVDKIPEEVKSAAVPDEVAQMTGKYDTGTGVGRTGGGAEEQQDRVDSEGQGPSQEDSLPQLDTSEPGTSTADDLFNPPEEKAPDGDGAGLESATEQGGEDLDKAASDLSKLNKASKIEKDGEEIAGATDEFDPVGLLLTAGLGIASAITAAKLKTHHTRNIIPAYTPETVGYGVQIGA